MTKKDRLKLIRETEKAIAARRKALHDDVEKQIAEEEEDSLAKLADVLGYDVGKKLKNGGGHDCAFRNLWFDNGSIHIACKIGRSVHYHGRLREEP